MTRSLWGNSQRRFVPEAHQGRATPVSAAPARHRPAQHRPRPFAVIDERRAEPTHYPTDQHGSARIGQILQGNSSGGVVANVVSPEFNAEQHRQSEIARIRNEIMDIAREVAQLQRRVHDNPTARSSRSRPPRVMAEIEKPKATVSAPREPKPRTPPYVPPPPMSDGGRPQRVEPAQRNLRFGKANPTSTSATLRDGRLSPSIRDEVLRIVRAKPKAAAKSAAGLKRVGIAAKAALFTGVILAGTGVIALGLLGKLPLAKLVHPTWILSETTASIPMSKATEPPHLQLASAVDHSLAFEVPETYGVYAISDGHLTPLEPLPVRIPDARVAISSPISKPAPTPLANGNLQFAVYHRELATNVPESASVRIVARVMQATTFVGGKPKTVAVEDTWAVRGGSIDFRIAPVAANKEMIVIRPADPTFTLSPGRYVLMFRNQAYDFSVAGTISKTAHCLERSELQDGSVYSECRELPAKL